MFKTLMDRLLCLTRAEIRLKVIHDLFYVLPSVQYGAICFVICTQTSMYVCMIVFDHKWLSPLNIVKLAIKNTNN
jgi:hypothetical protein